jgi:hypothetical protein
MVASTLRGNTLPHSIPHADRQMSRSLLDIRNYFAGKKYNAAADRHSMREIKAEHVDEDSNGADTAAASGWFDSSWDLRIGLDVQESSPGDAALNTWLGVWAAASAVPERHEKPGAGLVPAAAHGALGHTQKFADLGFGVAAEVAHLDELGEFGIDGLQIA